MWPTMTSEVILHFIKKKLRVYKVSIQVLFDYNRFINECARKNLTNTLHFTTPWDVEEITFLISSFIFLGYYMKIIFLFSVYISDDGDISSGKFKAIIFLSFYNRYSKSIRHLTIKL